jgi:hypothetical protein
MHRGINWHLIAMASALPLLAAFAAALPLWRSGRVIIGNTLAVFIVFAGCLFFGGSEYADALKFRYWCGETETPCPPTGTGDFLRLASFGVIAMTQAAAVYLASASLERQSERAQYDARWR